MRSSAWLWLLGVTLPAVASCTGQEDIALELCGSIEHCTGEPSSDACMKGINNGVDYYQISQTGLSRCADCLSNVSDCSSMLKGRVCDGACNEVPIALHATTTLADRQTGCALLPEPCPANGQNSCEEALTEELESDATLLADPALGACLTCLDEVRTPQQCGAAGAPSASSATCDAGAAGMDSAGAGGAAETCASASPALCQLAASCASLCAPQAVINARLTAAALSCPKDNLP